MYLNRIERRVFPGDSVEAANPALGEFIADLVAPYGLAVRPDRAARGHSYGEMAEALASGLLSDEAPVHLIILAHAMPDVIPGRATATYLSHLWPGQALAFAICDQGPTVGFTALTVAGRCLRPDERALVLVLEQAVLHHDGPPAPLPTAHAGVAMLLSGASAGSVALQPPRQHAGVEPERVADLLAGELAELAPDQLVVGAELAAHAGTLSLSCPARAAPPGQPATGVWDQFGVALATARGQVVVADYDPVLRYLCLLPAYVNPELGE